MKEPPASARHPTEHTTV